MTIKLTLANEELAKHPEAAKWIETCEKLINEEIENKLLDLACFGNLTLVIPPPSNRL